jgi:hypothetical protein
VSSLARRTHNSAAAHQTEAEQCRAVLNRCAISFACFSSIRHILSYISHKKIIREEYEGEKRGNQRERECVRVRERKRNL